MSLQKSIYVSILAGLLLINCLFGIIILQKKDGPEPFDVHEIRETVFLNTLIRNRSLDTTLHTIGITETSWQGVRFGLFIPPAPCIACVEAQENYLLSFMKDHELSFIVISPTHEERNTKAFFSSYPQVRIFGYDADSGIDDRISCLKSCVMFTISENHVEVFFVTNIRFPEMIGSFIENAY